MKTIRIKECDIVICCDPFEEDLKDGSIWVDFDMVEGFGPNFHEIYKGCTLPTYTCPHCLKEIEVR